MERLHPVLRGLLAAAPSSSSRRDGNILLPSRREAALARVEPQLRTIYEQREFGENPGRIPLALFRATWLPCSSGYTILEPGSNGGGRGRAVRYDTVTGARVDGLGAGAAGGDETAGGTQPLPAVESSPAEGGAVSNSRPVWSPDGKRAAYVQSDSTNVRVRPVLVHSDPSYPEVDEVRFARVGGEIPSLRVGVVAASGGETTWLQLPTPEEGLYLGQVEWAGNSDELLVERLSRARDERKFLLFDVESGRMSCIWQEADPAWVVASIAKNTGLEWVQDGRAFLVLSEKDGWRNAYLCSRDGTEQTLLTPGDYDIIEKVHINDDGSGGGFFYFVSAAPATQPGGE